MKTSKKEFANDGLEDLLNFCDNKEDNLMEFELNDEQPEELPTMNKWISKKVANKHKEQAKLKSDDVEQKPQTGKWVSKRVESKRKLEEEKNLNSKADTFSDDEFGGGDDEFEEEFGDGESEAEFDNEQFNDEFNEEFTDEEENCDSSSEQNEPIDENDLDFDKKSKFKEDIYGRLIDENGEIVKEKINKNLSTDNQVEKELTKKVRGLMNRIALKTLPFIVNELEEIFQKHSNNLVCRCMFNCIDQLVLSNQALASQKLCTEIAMLVAICHSRLGEEVSGNILHELVKTLDNMFDQLKDDNLHLDSGASSKEFENIIMILCSIYAVNIISDELIYNILDKLTEIFNSKSIELILFCLKLVGYLLRKDSTSSMKALIINVQQKANSFDKEKISEKKVMFMLNALTSIKNNVSLKMDLSDIQSIVPLDKQKIKSDLKSLFKDINVSCLKGKYNEILRSNRWFVHSNELLEISMKRTIEKQKEIALPTLSDKLCKKLQLTTPFRKLIFNTIFTCEDYVECGQNVVKSTKKDHFEVILVCLHICLSEKQFNQFYIHLLRYLAHVDRNYKRGILFNIREKIKNIENLSERQKSNLELVIVELIKLDVLTLIVFEVIDFKDMTELYKNFMSRILEELFKEDLSKLDVIFKKLHKKGSLSTSINVFISIFLSDDAKLKQKKLKSGLINENKIF